MLLVNPVSAGGRSLAVLAVTAELDRLRPRTGRSTRELEHAAEEAAAAAKDGETVATLGGDGLVRPVAGALRDSAAALAILPGDAATTSPACSACRASRPARVAVEGVERLLDVGEVDGTFIGIASLGFDSDATGSRMAARSSAATSSTSMRPCTPSSLGSMTFAVSRAARPAAAHPAGWSVGVGNSKAYGAACSRCRRRARRRPARRRHMRRAPDSRSCVSLAKVFKGAHLQLAQIEAYRGEEITVDANRPFDIYADGIPKSAARPRPCSRGPAASRS